MRGKKAKLARRMVADALPSEANGAYNLSSSGRLSRGSVMRILTEHVLKDNGFAIASRTIRRNPSIIHEPNSVRAVYRNSMKRLVTRHVS